MTGRLDREEGKAKGAALVRPATLGDIHLASRLYFGIVVNLWALEAGGATK